MREKKIKGRITRRKLGNHVVEVIEPERKISFEEAQKEVRKLLKQKSPKGLKFVFKFSKWKFVGYGKDYREAVRRLAPEIRFIFREMPEKIPLLVEVNGNSYWDIREFFKEAGIKI